MRLECHLQAALTLKIMSRHPVAFDQRRLTNDCWLKCSSNTLLMMWRTIFNTKVNLICFFLALVLFLLVFFLHFLLFFLFLTLCWFCIVVISFILFLFIFVFTLIFTVFALWLVFEFDICRMRASFVSGVLSVRTAFPEVLIDPWGPTVWALLSVRWCWCWSSCFLASLCCSCDPDVCKDKRESLFLSHNYRCSAMSFRVCDPW